MRSVFADTGFWVALHNARDYLHAKACELENSFDQFITREMVLAEFLNDAGSRGRLLRESAARFVAQLRSDGSVVIIPPDQRAILERKAALFRAIRQGLEPDGLRIVSGHAEADAG